MLEVNHAPSFNTDTALDKHTKTQLLQQTFAILGLEVGGKKREEQERKLRVNWRNQQNQNLNIKQKQLIKMQEKKPA